MVRHVLPLVAFLGGVAPALAVFGLGVLDARKKTVWAVLAVIAFAFFTLAVVPDQYAVFVRNTSGAPRLTLNSILFGTLGGGVVATLTAVLLQLGRDISDRTRWIDRFRAYPTEWFLLFWLGLDLIAYFVLSPYPAVRRALALVISATLVVGCLAKRRRAHPATVRAAMVASMMLSGLFYVADLLEAISQERAVEAAIEAIGARADKSTVWYVGCCGFHFAAERAGMQPLFQFNSRVSKGDWMIVPDRRVPNANACVSRDRMEPVATVQIVDGLPLTTMPSYYVGRTPMVHLDGPRRSAEVYRASKDFIYCQP
jgi:hypothetical protein